MAGLLLFARRDQVPVWFLGITLVLSVVVSGMMAWTAWIHRPETRHPGLRAVLTTAGLTGRRFAWTVRLLGDARKMPPDEFLEDQKKENVVRVRTNEFVIDPAAKAPAEPTIVMLNWKPARAR